MQLFSFLKAKIPGTWREISRMVLPVVKFAFIQIQKFRNCLITAAVYRYSSKQVFLKISEYPQESTCAELSLK